MNILLVGAMGKMANSVKDIALENNIKIIAELDKNFDVFTSKGKIENKAKNKQNCYTEFSQIPNEIVKQIDVVLDFSSPEILKEEIKFCVIHSLPILICTTGHNESNLKLIKKHSKIIPIFISANTSFGINLISSILKSYSKFFDGYNINIVETHHKNKLDAPSGTAKLFAQILSSYSPATHSIRAGEIVGTHDIILTNTFEQITISHIAFDRKLFAQGAIKICHFLNKKLAPKVYTMEDIFK